MPFDGPTNTYKTYEAVGRREDLSDLVTNISPVDTLFYSSIGSTEVTQTKHEWVTDSLGNAGSNAKMEGGARTALQITAVTRLYNMCQIQSKTFALSDTNPKVSAAGGVTKEDYHTAKFLKELAKDIEYAFLQEVRADGDADTARKMRGALNWTTTNLDKASDATLNADGTVTGGTARALTEEIFAGVCQNVWAAGGAPTVVYCGGFQKRQFSSFAGAGNYRTNVTDKELKTSIDVYVGDFGTYTIKPHRGMPTSAVFICDTDYWKKATLRGTTKRELAKTGDARIWDITVEHTLEARTELASGRITSLTTS